MNISKVLILLMLVASASSAFAGVRKKAPAARVQVQAQPSDTCMYKSGGAHNKRPQAASKNLVAGLLGLNGTKGTVKTGSATTTR